MDVENGSDEIGNNHKHDEAKTSDKNGRETSTNGEKEKEKGKQETVPFHKLFTFADSTDILLMAVGTIGAVGNGLGLPVMTLLFGQMINSFGGNQTNADDVVEQVSKVSLKFVYLAIGCGVAAFLGLWLPGDQRHKILHFRCIWPMHSASMYW